MGALTERGRSRADSSRTDDIVYVCRGCGDAFAVAYHVCPECGGYRVERAWGVRPDAPAGEERTRVERLVAGLRRRLSVNRTFDESNTARIRK